MMSRAQLDAELDRLEGMLPVWYSRIRHRAQFWPQFRALAEAITANTDAADIAYAKRRIAAMLRANLPPGEGG